METPDRTVKIPKVCVTKPRTPVDDNFAASDWVERRKRKKVILQDLMDTKKRLDFLDVNKNVCNIKWGRWK